MQRLSLISEHVTVSAAVAAATDDLLSTGGGRPKLLSAEAVDQFLIDGFWSATVDDLPVSSAEASSVRSHDKRAD